MKIHIQFLANATVSTKIPELEFCNMQATTFYLADLDTCELHHYFFFFHLLCSLTLGITHKGLTFKNL